MTDRETEGTTFSTSDAAVFETAVYGESRYGRARYARAVPETMVIDESPLDGSVLGAPDSPATLHAILTVVSNHAFPRQRVEMTKGQRRQLRDAMALEAHARDRRDVFVSEDVTAFVRHGRRDKLERLCQTRILTVDEFCASVATLAADAERGT